MKLLFVTCLEDFRSDVVQIFRESNIPVFSLMEATGIKNENGDNLMDDWFGNKHGEFKSLVLFSFTTADAASAAMGLIRRYNEKESKFPVRAFIMPVEKSNFLLQ